MHHFYFRTLFYSRSHRIGTFDHCENLHTGHSRSWSERNIILAHPFGQMLSSSLSSVRIMSSRVASSCSALPEDGKAKCLILTRVRESFDALVQNVQI